MFNFILIHHHIILIMFKHNHHHYYFILSLIIFHYLTHNIILKINENLLIIKMYLFINIIIL